MKSDDRKNITVEIFNREFYRKYKHVKNIYTFEDKYISFIDKDGIEVSVENVSIILSKENKK